MAETAYCDIEELKTRIDAGEDEDALLDPIMEAVSRWIDEVTGKRFYSTDSDEVRYFNPEFDDVLYIPMGLLSLTSLVTDPNNDRSYNSSWTVTTDYELEPVNATLDGKPYTEIRIAPQSSKYFPSTVRRGAKLTGKFGYSATAPSGIQQSCLLQSAYLWKRKDAILGASGPATMGQLVVQFGKSVKTHLDSDAQALLFPYMDLDILGV